MLSLGDTIKVLLDYTWNGKNLISEIALNQNDQTVGSYTVDREQGQIGVNIVKGLPQMEIWDFIVKDNGGHQAILSLTLTLDPGSQNKPIKYYDNITLGAQSNLTRPGFMSLTNATYYNLDGAFQNQSVIDFFFYYDDVDMATLASAGADVPEGIYTAVQAPGIWTTRNTTYFQEVDISAEEFYGIFHDGFIVENFDEDSAEKKATNLAQGDLYLFKLESGKKGLLYVIEIEAETDGLISFAVKVQE